MVATEAAAAVEVAAVAPRVDLTDPTALFPLEAAVVVHPLAPALELEAAAVALVASTRLPLEEVVLLKAPGASRLVAKAKDIVRINFFIFNDQH